MGRVVQSGRFAGAALPIMTVLGPRAYIADSGAWDNNTFRQYIEAAQLLDYGGNEMRLTIAAAVGEALNIVAAYIGKRSGTYGFAATPVPVLFAGNPTKLIAANTFGVSDWLPFPTTGLDDLVFSAFITGSSTDGFGRREQTGTDGYYKAGNDAANVAPSGYSQGGAAGRLRNCFQLIEVR